MSNPAVFLLASTEIHDQIVRFEDNLGESIHIHVGLLRISLTVQEFLELVNSLTTAAQQLLECYGIDLNTLDISALDWDWLQKAPKLQSISIQTVQVGQLYSTKMILNHFGMSGLQIIVPIHKARIVQALRGKTGELLAYEQMNLDNQSNLERLETIKSLIAHKGYPFHNKFILVNQNNQIYDGDHRAGCIFDLYGPEKRIPVIKMRFADEDNIRQLLSKQRQQIAKYIMKSMLSFPEKALRVMQKRIFALHSSGPSTAKSFPLEDYTEAHTLYFIIRFLKDNNISFFVLPNNIKKDKKVIADKGIIIESSGFPVIKSNWHKYIYDSPYAGTPFLYSVAEPIYLCFGTCKFLIYECLCCKSVFSDAMIPMDKYITEKAWESKKWNPTLECYEIDVKIELIYTIVQCMCEKKEFEKADIEFLSIHRDIIRDADFKSLISREFFGYTDALTAYLLNGEYEKCVNEYLTNTDY